MYIFDCYNAKYYFRCRKINYVMIKPCQVKGHGYDY